MVHPLPVGDPGHQGPGLAVQVDAALLLRMGAHLVSGIIVAGQIPFPVPALVIDRFLNADCPRLHLVRNRFVLVHKGRHFGRMVQGEIQSDGGPYAFTLAAYADAVQGVIPVPVMSQHQMSFTQILGRITGGSENMLPHSGLPFIQVGHHNIQKAVVPGFLQISIDRRRNPNRAVGIDVGIQRQPSPYAAAVPVLVAQGFQDLFFGQRRIKGSDGPGVLKLVPEAFSRIPARLGAKLHLLLDPVVHQGIHFSVRSFNPDGLLHPFTGSSQLGKIRLDPAWGKQLLGHAAGPVAGICGSDQNVEGAGLPRLQRHRIFQHAHHILVGGQAACAAPCCNGIRILQVSVGAHKGFAGAVVTAYRLAAGNKSVKPAMGSVLGGIVRHKKLVAAVKFGEEVGIIIAVNFIAGKGKFHEGKQLQLPRPVRSVS
ncbi:hypothetical protein D3C75_637670 [compost metagenome]